MIICNKFNESEYGMATTGVRTSTIRSIYNKTKRLDVIYSGNTLIIGYLIINCSFYCCSLVINMVTNHMIKLAYKVNGPQWWLVGLIRIVIVDWSVYYNVRLPSFVLSSFPLCFIFLISCLSSFGLIYFRPCQHDNSYIDGRSQFQVYTDERIHQVHSAQTSLVVTHPSPNRRRCLNFSERANELEIPSSGHQIW